MLKSNDRWGASDIVSIAEYCVTSGMSASFTQKSRDLFNEFMVKSVLESYPKEGTVSFSYKSTWPVLLYIKDKKIKTLLNICD